MTRLGAVARAQRRHKMQCALNTHCWDVQQGMLLVLLARRGGGALMAEVPLQPFLPLLPVLPLQCACPQSQIKHPTNQLDVQPLSKAHFWQRPWRSPGRELLL